MLFKSRLLTLTWMLTLILGLSYQELQASETIIKDKASCETLSGRWNEPYFPSNTCSMYNTVPGSNDIWIVADSITLYSWSTYSYILGTIINNGKLIIQDPFQDLVLYGTINNYGLLEIMFLDIGGTGVLYNEGTILNKGTLSNYGISGAVINKGNFINNFRLIGGVENHGTLKNIGGISLYNPEDISNKAGAIIENVDTGDIVGDGSIINDCGGIINNSGIIEVNIDQEVDCAPAFSALITEVKNIEIASSGIENSLTRILEKAEMHLANGNVSVTLNQLEAFINHVQALIGNKLTTEDGMALIDFASAIIDTLSEN